jgi:hypothetical protein
MNKNFLKFITSPLTIIILLFAIQFTLYEYMTLAPEWSAPPDTVYTRIYGYDAIYVSWMRQSALGAWAIRDQRTTAPIPSVYVYPLFIILGKIAGVTHIDSEQIYLLSKVVGGALAFIAIYILIAEFIPKASRATALLMLLGVEMGPWWYVDAPILGLGTVLRHFAVPHHTIGEAIGFIFVILYYRNVYDARRTRLIWLFILGFIGTSVLLPFMVPLFITLGLVFGAIALRRKVVRSYLVTSIIAGLSIAIPGLIYAYEFSLGPPWNNSAHMESVFYSTHDMMRQYGMSLFYYVPFFVLAIIFLPLIWGKLSRKLQDISILGFVGVCIPFLFWAVLPYISFPIANWRFIDIYYPIYPGLVSLMGLFAAWKVIGAKGKWGKTLLIIFTGVIVVLSGYTTWNYTHQTVEERKIRWSNIFVPVPVWQAVQFFWSVPINSGILSLVHFGDIIADHAPVRVYVARAVYADFGERAALAQVFFSGTLSATAAHDFLKNNDISYVFYGPQERESTTVFPLYPMVLTDVFHTSGATVYKVK